MKMNKTEKIEMEVAKNIIYHHISEVNPRGIISIVDESDGFNIYVNNGFARFVCYFNGAEGICNLLSGIHDSKILAAQLKILGLKVRMI